MFAMIVEKYEGYSNKPTWIIATWLKNNLERQDYWRMKSEKLPCGDLIRELKLSLEDVNNPLIVRGSIYKELLSFSMGLIDWNEIIDIFKEKGTK
jgi:hypothetical protein